MKEIGIFLWISGLAMFGFAAFGMDTSIASGSDLFGGSRTINIGLQQSQMLAAIAGLTLFLAGSIIHALGEIFPKPVRPLDTPVGPLGRTVETQVLNSELQPITSDREMDRNWKAEMQQLGVVQSDDSYEYGPYRYTNLTDAIQYAKTHQHERT